MNNSETQQAIRTRIMYYVAQSQQQGHKRRARILREVFLPFALLLQDEGAQLSARDLPVSDLLAELDDLLANMLNEIVSSYTTPDADAYGTRADNRIGNLIERMDNFEQRRQAREAAILRQGKDN